MPVILRIGFFSAPLHNNYTSGHVMIIIWPLSKTDHNGSGGHCMLSPLPTQSPLPTSTVYVFMNECVCLCVGVVCVGVCGTVFNDSTKNIIRLYTVGFSSRLQRTNCFRVVYEYSYIPIRYRGNIFISCAPAASCIICIVRAHDRRYYIYLQKVSNHVPPAAGLSEV